MYSATAPPSAEFSAPAPTYTAEVIQPVDVQDDFVLLTPENLTTAVIEALATQREESVSLKEGNRALEAQNDHLLTKCVEVIGENKQLTDQNINLSDRVTHLENSYGITEEELAAALAQICKLHDKLANKTYLLETDDLTGLLSEVGLAETIRRLDPTKPTIMLNLDMGHFKLFNDRKGHAFGDKVLKEIARGLVTSCRSKDIIARLGGKSQLDNGKIEPDRVSRKQGDEFIYICQIEPDSGLDIHDIAQGIIERMRSLSQDIADTLPEAADIQHFHIDIGYAQYDFASSYEENLKTVDTLMYKDKIAQCDNLGCPMELRHRRGEGLSDAD